MTSSLPAGRPVAAGGVDSAYAWMRLAVSLLISAIGGVGMWSVSVALPTLQADFGVDRAEATMPYTLTMVGVMFGSMVMGRLADRYGVVLPLVIGAAALGLGYVLASMAPSLWPFALAQGVLIGMIGCSASFGPLISDISHWFERRRGLAVALAASGSYLAGTVWPPVVQHLIETLGWRQAHFGIGIFCVVAMLPLIFLLRRRAPGHGSAAAASMPASAGAGLGLSPAALQALLVIAGIACCVAMSMPQVHIVAYCSGLGYGTARGAEMLSVMLGFGIVSRLATGWIADRIGGLPTLVLGSALQALALLLYIPFDGLVSLYVISALFGLSQGGIVPSYAMIIRAYFPASQAGTRVGLVLAATVGGMAIGGWMSGKIYDLAGGYQAAFGNGAAWNLLHLAIAWFLFQRARRGPGGRMTAAAAA